MVLTQDRADLLAEYLEADLQRAKELFEIDIEDALVKINADGYDFTVEELQEFATELENVSQNSAGELGEEELENVAGGAVYIPAWKLARKFLKLKLIILT